jgi:hypothetical protein
MEFPQRFEKRAGLAQNPRRQQIGLRMKNSRLQPPVFGFAHHPLHVLLDDLEVFQKRSFKLAASVGIIGHLPDPLQGQPHMALLDGFPK